MAVSYYSQYQFVSKLRYAIVYILLDCGGGAIGQMTSEDWKTYEQWLIDEIDSIYVCVPAKYDRCDPENDAFFIAWRWINANIYAERQRQKTNTLEQQLRDAKDEIERLKQLLAGHDTNVSSGCTSSTSSIPNLSLLLN